MTTGPEPTRRHADTVVLDVDGTLVDSVYTHVGAWMRAFRGIGIPVEGWRLHRAIGMGGDRLVTEVAGQRVEEAVGDQARELHDQEYDELVPGVLALPGADALLEMLKQRGFTVVLASSGTKTQTEQALEKLERPDLADAWVCSADVDVSKPAPDLVEAAISRVGGTKAVMIGDAVWDVQAAQRLGIDAIGLRCGGFPDSELREAGAVALFDNPQDLVDRFDETGLTSSAE
jgi:HAD superfamily hydrolase (TIGR01549 family)